MGYIRMKGGLARTDDDAYLLLSGTSPPEVSLLGNRQLSTLALWQRYPRFCALTNNKDVGDPIIANSWSSLVHGTHNVTYRVANVRSRESLTWTISKPPICFSR